MEYKLIVGVAGTGKSYQLLKRSEEQGDILVCSTTGISAINLGTITLHSTLYFFDTKSLYERLQEGKLQSRLYQLQKQYSVLAIDEVSMMHADQLDIIVRGIEEVNNYEGSTRELSLILTGDFAQLPPVPDKDKAGNSLPLKWAFDAECWHHFESNTEKLTKIWRQTDVKFIEALNLARSGNGSGCVDLLHSLGVVFNKETLDGYEGTTIFSKNQQVDTFNWQRLRQLPGPYITVKPNKWGEQLKEWQRNIPEELRLKLGCYVMLLSNKYEGPFDEREMVYANGDCGHIVDVAYKQDGEVDYFTVELERKGIGGDDLLVTVERTTRYHEQKSKPEDLEEKWPDEQTRPYRDESRKRWIFGTIDYFPVRVCYATTCHKSQGLSLDKIQLDYRNRFFGMENMLYVALSRCRTPGGLRLVGPERIFVQRCNVSPRVVRWL